MQDTQKTKIAKWGNSVAIRIPDAVVRQARLSLGSAVSISFVNNRIQIRKTAEDELSLDEMIRRITPKNRHTEKWLHVEPVGKEIW